MSQDNPLVSVIIPAYNAEKTIEETLQSILQQTYENIEIIIVDDGSTDATPDIVNNLSTKHKNIRLITQKNAGVATARNTAIEASKGEYIAPIDADDLWHTQRLEMHVRALNNAGPEAAVAYSPFYVIDPESNILGKGGNYDLSGKIFSDFLKRNIVGNGSGLLVRKSAFEKVGGYAPLLQDLGAEGCEDYLVQLQLAYDYRYVSVPYYLIGYRRSPGNMSSDKIKMKRSEIFMYNHIKENYEVDETLFKQAKIETLSRLLPFVLQRHGVKGFREEILPHMENFYDHVLLWALTFKYIFSRVAGKFIAIWKKIGFTAAHKNEKRKFEDISSLEPETS